MAVRHRLLFAVQPVEAQLGPIARHRDGLTDVHGLVGDPGLRLTLAITEDFAEFPADMAHELYDMGSNTQAEPVSVRLERLSAAPGSVILRPGRTSRELKALQRGLAERMTSRSLSRCQWSFRPHVTLAYRTRGKPFARPIEPIAWESHEFVLIHSEGESMSDKRLGRWPLAWRQGRLF